MSRDFIDIVKLMSFNELAEVDIIPWGSPIPSFGNLLTAKIATVGLNPSNREFVDVAGQELNGPNRRFHTLNSLGLLEWRHAKTKHYELILEYCFNYFNRNPYDGWFKKLDNLISGTSLSYYFPSGFACHLDLIPYATFTKWAYLSPLQQKKLLEFSSDYLGLLINQSEISTLVLNGQTVVSNLEKVSGCEFEKTEMSDWALPRKTIEDVQGCSYRGYITRIGNISLNRSIEVLGYNHNIQSSFGVTKGVQLSIRKWISESIMTYS